MQRTIIEFKARMRNEKRVQAALKSLHPRLAGTDHQIDTYFRTASGRLKLRQGKIENSLIFYRRKNAAQVRASRVLLCEFSGPGEVQTIKSMLASALGILAVVEKVREIYFVENVKIHLDRVRRLGKFLEVEALVRNGNVRGARKQAEHIKRLSGVAREDILRRSYSDLVLEHGGTRRKIHKGT